MMLVGAEEGTITCFGDPRAAAHRAALVEHHSNNFNRGRIEARAVLLGDA